MSYVYFCQSQSSSSKPGEILNLNLKKSAYSALIYFYFSHTVIQLPLCCHTVSQLPLYVIQLANYPYVVIQLANYPYVVIQLANYPYVSYS